MKPIERFKQLYTINLTKSVTNHPDKYYITLDDVPSVVDKVVGIIESQGVATVTHSGGLLESSESKTHSAPGKHTFHRKNHKVVKRRQGLTQNADSYH